jgi:hypothetical protein
MVALERKVISNAEATQYISAELYGRIKSDDIKSMNDIIDGALHLGFYSKNRLIGVFSLGIFKDYVMLHPKVNIEHMIYAKRICESALDYAKEAGARVAFAKFPSGKKNTKKMAGSCKMTLHETLKNHKSVNGVFIDVDVYKRVL